MLLGKLTIHWAKAFKAALEWSYGFANFWEKEHQALCSLSVCSWSVLRGLRVLLSNNKCSVKTCLTHIIRQQFS